MFETPVASFTKEVNLRLAKCPLETNGRLANHRLTSLVKMASGVIELRNKKNIANLIRINGDKNKPFPWNIKQSCLLIPNMTNIWYQNWKPVYQMNDFTNAIAWTLQCLYLYFIIPSQNLFTGKLIYTVAWISNKIIFVSYFLPRCWSLF